MIACGIDEAGRGSFIGPLVIAGVAIEETSLPYLYEEGVRDSKVLSPRTRMRLYDTILNVATGYVIKRVRPRTIDNSVLFHGLADLEMERMAAIMAHIFADIYYVDSCYADASLFERRLSRLAGDKRVRAYTKADSQFTVVAAASILAKVSRDKSISSIRRTHHVGSGYPSDSRAADCVAQIYHTTGMFPDFARRSWYTACRIAGDERMIIDNETNKVT